MSGTRTMCGRRPQSMVSEDDVLLPALGPDWTEGVMKSI